MAEGVHGHYFNKVQKNYLVYSKFLVISKCVLYFSICPSKAMFPYEILLNFSPGDQVSFTLCNTCLFYIASKHKKSSTTEIYLFLLLRHQTPRDGLLGVRDDEPRPSRQLCGGGGHGPGRGQAAGGWIDRYQIDRYKYIDRDRRRYKERKKEKSLQAQPWEPGDSWELCLSVHSSCAGLSLARCPSRQEGNL